MEKKLTLLLCLSVFYVSFSQEANPKENKTDALIDDLLEQNQIIDSFLASYSKYQFLYLTVNYNDDTYFSGRDIGIDQYNINPRITYLHYSGLYGSVAGIYYSEFDPKWDLTTATIGYGKNFGKKKTYRYSVSYSRYFYNNGIDNLFTNDISASIGIKNKKRTLGTSLSGSYLFGKDESFQIASSSFVAFNLFKTTKTKLDFKPQISLVAGKQTVELARSYMRFGQLVTEYGENDVFSMINTQLSFPLEFSYNSFDVGVGYTINFPTAIGDESDLKSTGFFNVSMSYLLDL
nr:hypothetical protein [uncultured Flavobacterium sp.]